MWPEEASRYPLLEVATGKGNVRLALFDEVDMEKSAERRTNLQVDRCRATARTDGCGGTDGR